VSITGTSAGTATLTITTTAATSAALALPKRNGVPWYAAGGAALAGVLFFGIPARRRSWRTMLGMLVFLAALTGGVLTSGCGGSGGGGGGGGTGSPGTTAGTYTVTVTGTSGTTTATGTVTLTVQ
jgi:FtsH-binding integral membrane protein